MLARAFQRLPPPLPTQKQCILDFAWFETIYSGRIIKCRIHNMNLAHSVSEKKNITPSTAREEISYISCPVSASDTSFMIVVEGFPNSGLYHSFTHSYEMILGSSHWHVGLPAADLHGPFIKSRVQSIKVSISLFCFSLSCLPIWRCRLHVHCWLSNSDLECQFTKHLHCFPK